MSIAQRPRAGELLVASVSHEGFFAQTVIYLLDVDDSGALGVVLNRIAEADLDDVLPSWVSLVSPPQLLFQGGPVSPNGAICVSRLNHASEEPPGWRRVSGDIGLLHLDTPTEIVSGTYANLRIFAGYAGWDAGQLEGELLRGDWHRVPARDADLFGADQRLLWRRVLRRQGGTLGQYSTWVDDPDQN